MPCEIDEDWLVTWTGQHPGSVSHIEYMTDQWWFNTISTFMPHQNNVVANVTDIRIRQQCRFHSMSEPGAQDLQLYVHASMSVKWFPRAYKT